MWPATLVAGMLLLLGAIGTATAPTAYAAAGDVCDIEGPFPVVEADSNDLDAHDDDLAADDIQGKLLVGTTYIFVIYVEDAVAATGGPNVSVEIDDEEGDADLTSYVNAVGPDYVELANGVDVLPGLVPITLAGLATVQAEIEAVAGVALDADQCGTVGPNDGLVVVDVTCEDPGRFELTAYAIAGPDNSRTAEALCVANANAATLTAVPTTVESVPAAGNISHSLLVLVLTDSDGRPAAPGQRVDWSTDLCLIEGRTETEYEVDGGIENISDAALFAGFTPATAHIIENNYEPPHDTGAAGLHGVGASSASLSFENDPAGPPPVRTIATAILHCENAAPGVANILAEIERSGPDLQARTTVTVVGPPAFITITAAPNRLVCGEKATILVTVTDAINQRVSDHTRVELITNFGGVLGGTGGTLGFPGTNPVSPLSSGAAETFGGVATAYLLTSTQHVGAYEVVAASGGSALGGVFSTPVVTSQVTVTCTVGAPTTTAPSTGTGSITPPSTGDAGLASASSSSAMMFVIAGAVAFVLAGLASYGYARR
jgi:hypothetical protein